MLNILLNSAALSRCNTCERLFNCVMDLEHHKEEYSHWSDNEDSDSEEEMDDINGNISLVYEEETVFGAEVEERMLLCSQD